MENATKETLARVLNYVMLNEETSYEETIDEYGIGSEQEESHIYALARTLWAELELDYT